MSEETSCPRCGAPLEDLYHVIWGCPDNDNVGDDHANDSNCADNDNENDEDNGNDNINQDYGKGHGKK